MGMYEDFGDCTLFYRHALWLTPRKNKFPYIKHTSAVFCQAIIAMIGRGRSCTIYLFGFRIAENRKDALRVACCRKKTGVMEFWSNGLRVKSFLSPMRRCNVIARNQRERGNLLFSTHYEIASVVTLPRNENIIHPF